MRQEAMGLDLMTRNEQHCLLAGVPDAAWLLKEDNTHC
jgi:hypothetical protein